MDTNLEKSYATICSIYMHFLVVTQHLAFGIGKMLALKNYLKDCNFRKCASVFIKSEDISTGDINYGEKAMIILFGKKPEEKLDSIRLSLFFAESSRQCKICKARKLPPTSAATNYHSLRTYYQRTSDTLIGYLPIFHMLPKTSLCIRYHWYPFE